MDILRKYAKLILAIGLFMIILAGFTSTIPFNREVIWLGLTIVGISLIFLPVNRNVDYVARLSLFFAWVVFIMLYFVSGIPDNIRLVMRSLYLILIFGSIILHIWVKRVG